MSNKLTNKDKQILSVYEYWDNDDYSTEMLLQLVADTCNCSISDVVDTLIRSQNTNNKYGGNNYEQTKTN